MSKLSERELAMEYERKWRSSKRPRKGALLEVGLALLVLAVLWLLIIVFGQRALGAELTLPAPRVELDTPFLAPTASPETLSPEPKVTGLLEPKDAHIASQGYFSYRRDLDAHRFYDRRGKVELAIVAGVGAADMAQTCRNLANGGHEDFQRSQSCAGNVAIQVGWTLAGEGLALVLHRMGHHRLEQLPRAYVLAGNVRGIIYSREHGAW